MILGVLAVGLPRLKANGLTNAQAFRGHPDSVTGASVLAAHFPAGAGEPVIVIGNPSAAVVRLLLVTALNLDVGRWVWWPGKLAQKPDPAPGELSRSVPRPRSPADRCSSAPGKPAPGHRVTVRVSPRRRAEVTLWRCRRIPRLSSFSTPTRR